MPCRKKCFGIFKQQIRWGISARGWIVFLLLFLATALAIAWSIQPFLAKTARVGSRYLVVEGWVHEYAIRAAADEFKSGQYEKIFTTGGPVVGSKYINDFNTSASVGAELLEKDGIPKRDVQPVPAREVGRDRTYASAISLRRYFQTNGISVHAINVLTEDTHARRTQLLFQEAFGRDVAVGIISIPDPDYDARHWWRTSEGVRNVLDEGIAYIYARFFFFPPKTN
ncbi:MAG TPA: ElyC/SanA/YdcF family protein [Verrucomicrobiae bacterium]|nr:ElyC/SanA/YdcF family protein [Verrucomicrobiae bacterium]